MIVSLMISTHACMYMISTHTCRYANDSDDRLAQLCQMQIFFTLVSSMMLRWDELNAAAGGRPTQNLDVLLCAFTFLPISFALVVHVLEEGLYDYFKDTLVDPTMPYVEPVVAHARAWIELHRPRRALMTTRPAEDAAASTSRPRAMLRRHPHAKGT